MTSELTVSAPPSTVDVVQSILATMSALSGIVTDYNPGSQVRTIAEATGAVIEQQGVWSQAIAFQAAVYGALSAFTITPFGANPASGTVSFTTQIGSGAPPVNQNVSIPSGTIVQTAGSIQFLTTAASLLASGSSAVNVAVVAAIGGSAGNVPGGSITQIVNGLSYPLQVTNASGTAGGINAESSSQTLARFAALRASVPGSTPNAIANAAIGVSVSGTGETCLYSTLYEPWILQGSGFYGWDLYLDNGTGSASAALIAAVGVVLSSGTASNPYGFRDAGVPYSILSVTPTIATVSISGALSSLGSISAVSGAIASAVSGYFALPFGAAAQQAQISAAVANSSLGLLNSLTVSLYLSGSGSPVTGLVPPVTGRVILGALSIYLTQ